MSLFLVILPFVVFIWFLLKAKMSLLKVSLLTLAIVTFSVIFYWQILPQLLLLSYVKGFFIALDIFFIIFGAIFFLSILQNRGIIANLSKYLESFSKDYRVQVIILAWFFENFLEGTAGFGMGSAVVAALLIGLGLKPLRAVIIALIANSAAGVFGAAGTPIKIGLAGLNTAGVPLIASLINCFAFIVPIFLLWALVSDKIDRKRQFFEALPFAIISGLAFVIPSVFCVFLGQEFPTILGSVIGLLLIYLCARFNILLPKNIRAFDQENTVVVPELSKTDKIKTILPYLILIVLLIAGKFILSPLVWNISLLAGGSHTLALFNPGFIFVITGLLVMLIFKIKREVLFSCAKLSLIRAIEPFLVILAMSAMVQLMINSGNNYSGFASAIAILAKSFENVFLPAIAPFVIAFGSFITGSVTISNIMFGNFLSYAATAMNMSAAKILALGVVGGATGNMMALADILSTEAAAGMKNRERELLRAVVLPCLFCLAVIALIGMLII